MLDLDHPQTQFIFQAAGLVDALLLAERQMIRILPVERKAIFSSCQELILKLHRLNDEHFAASEKNYDAVCEIEASLRSLCVQDTKQFGDEIEPCARCGKQLIHFKAGKIQVVYCSYCSQVTEAAKIKLGSSFGLMFI